ncbi:peroxiredoxin [Breznakia blatticola]|uniref:Peroxiredoxin n=1 Tax=Breznakia blatticola TaxID=1754012 RepID=A0A4R7ZFV9_9FIRM|nr:hypothetical protein [Breznakia blatticola]TDW16543.1 peroxiredoxin [Breznakia blatticola]
MEKKETTQKSNKNQKSYNKNKKYHTDKKKQTSTAKPEKKVQQPTKQEQPVKTKPKHSRSNGTKLSKSNVNPQQRRSNHPNQKPQQKQNRKPQPQKQAPVQKPKESKQRQHKDVTLKTTEVFYTRNLEPLETGFVFPSIEIMNPLEEVLDLHDIREPKVYITLPSLEDNAMIKDAKRLEVLLEKYPDVKFYLITNEPVYTQLRLAKEKQLKGFELLSDFKLRNFARYTGTYIYEIENLVKAVFIVDHHDQLKHVEYYDDLYSNFQVEVLDVEISKINQ